MSDMPEFILDREFDAPRELVWRAWTSPEILQRWFGAHGLAPKFCSVGMAPALRPSFTNSI